MKRKEIFKVQDSPQPKAQNQVAPLKANQYWHTGESPLALLCFPYPESYVSVNLKPISNPSILIL